MSDEVYNNHHPFPGNTEDVTWCNDRDIVSVEVEYVRADLVRDAMPVNWHDDKNTRALARALGMLTPTRG